MNPERFAKLTHRQKEALIIAMHVRNEMEDFHVKNLSDAQMKELNPIIRKAILEGLTLWEKGMWHSLYNKDKKPDEWVESLGWTLMMIPDYWEIPTEAHINKEMRKLRKTLSESKTKSK